MAINFAAVPTAALTGLKIQPLEYSAKLDKAQKQRGVVDISNPADKPVEVKLSTQAVRQINDVGELEFYDDEAISAGVRLDQKSFRLPAHGAYRLVFVLDGSKLPPGDSVAAILAQTVGEEASVSSSARVGTMLFITNGTPSGRDMAVADLDVNWLQSTGAVVGQYNLVNQDEAATTGFRPEVKISLSPLHQATTTTGPLVFAGRQRAVNFSVPSTALGVYRLTVSSGDSQQSRWVLLLPAWSFIAFFGLLLVGFGWRYARRKVRARRSAAPSSQPRQNQ